MIIDGDSLVLESVVTLDCCDGRARCVTYTSGFQTQHNHASDDCPVLTKHWETMRRWDEART